MIVNLYKPHFLFSYFFSSQPNPKSFPSLHSSTSPTKHKWGKIKYFLSSHFSILPTKQILILFFFFFSYNLQSHKSHSHVHLFFPYLFLFFLILTRLICFFLPTSPSFFILFLNSNFKINSILWRTPRSKNITTTIWLNHCLK